MPQQIELLRECPICKKKYSDNASHLIDARGIARLMHLTCQNCHHSMLTMVLQTPMGLSSMGLLTDLNFDDVMRFREIGPITADEVLNVHNELRGNES